MKKEPVCEYCKGPGTIYAEMRHNRLVICRILCEDCYAASYFANPPAGVTVAVEMLALKGEANG